MFLLRLPNFWQYLDEPVINFVTELNGLEEDFESTGATSTEMKEPPVIAGKRGRSNTIDDAELRKNVNGGGAPGTGLLQVQNEVKEDLQRELSGEDDEEEDEEGEDEGSSEESEEEKDGNAFNFVQSTSDLLKP